MSNVKPRDIARVVNSIDGNEGKQLYITGYDRTNWYGIWWKAELLQPGWSWNGLVLKRIDAGKEVSVADNDVRRIDPPADETSDSVVQERETAS